MVVVLGRASYQFSESDLESSDCSARATVPGP